MARIDVTLSSLHSDIIAITTTAAKLALSHFRLGEKTHAEVSYKNGVSPVTAADHAVDAYLKLNLLNLLPEAGWLSEETEDGPQRLTKSRLFIVDPIDGTRAFMSGDPRWAVSVALVENGRPIIAVLVAPALDESFTAQIGQGALLNGKALPRLPAFTHPAVAAGPVTVLDRLRDSGLEMRRVPKIPSLAYRLVSVAANTIDIGLAGPNAHDWDIAAADLILRESHVPLTGFANQPIVYNRVDSRHGGLVAARDPLHKTICAVLGATASAPAH